MWVFSRERRERVGSTANGRVIRRGGVVAIMIVGEDENLMKYD